MSNGVVASYWGLFVLSFLSWIVASTITILAIGATVAMLFGYQKVGGLLSIVNSLLMSMMLVVLIAAGVFPSSGMPATLDAISYFWVVPSLLLLIGAATGLSSGGQWKPLLVQELGR